MKTLLHPRGARLKPDVWLAAVDRLFQSEYALTIKYIGEDAAVLHETWSGGATPAQYVRWFGRKYDLISRDEWLLSKRVAALSL